MAQLKQRIDRFNFEKNNVTIARLHDEQPLPVNYIGQIRRDYEIATTRFGQFTWTQCETWQKALQFYEKYHLHPHLGIGILITTPILNPRARPIVTLLYAYEIYGLQLGSTIASVPVNSQCYATEIKAILEIL